MVLGRGTERVLTESLVETMVSKHCIGWFMNFLPDNMETSKPQYVDMNVLIRWKVVRLIPARGVAL